MTRPLRIALVVDPFRRPRRGIEHPTALARELLGRGHAVRGLGAPQSVIPRGGDDAQDLTAGLMGFQPDVIVAYVVDSPAAWKGARAAGKLQVPLVLVEEGFPVRGRTFGRILRALGGRLWGSTVHRRATRVVALDPVAQADLLERGFDRERVALLAPGVDLTRYRPGLSSHLLSDHGIRGRILLVCAALREEVGVDQIVRAFAATVGRGGDWSLVLAGDGPARPGLRALADRLGVGAQVHWLTPSRRDVLPGLLGASTLLLAPVDPEDVSGWRLRRALACGLPVLAQRCPSHDIVVEHDGCGLLVEQPSAEAWELALRVATGGPQRRQRWSLRARELAESRYDWSEVTARVETVLFEAVDELRPQACAQPKQAAPEAKPEGA